MDRHDGYRATHRVHRSNRGGHRLLIAGFTKLIGGGHWSPGAAGIRVPLDGRRRHRGGTVIQHPSRSERWWRAPLSVESDVSIDAEAPRCTRHDVRNSDPLSPGAGLLLARFAARVSRHLEPRNDVAPQRRAGPTRRSSRRGPVRSTLVRCNIEPHPVALGVHRLLPPDGRSLDGRRLTHGRHLEPLSCQSAS